MRIAEAKEEEQQGDVHQEGRKKTLIISVSNHNNNNSLQLLSPLRSSSKSYIEEKDGALPYSEMATPSSSSLTREDGTDIASLHKKVEGSNSIHTGSSQYEPSPNKGGPDNDTTEPVTATQVAEIKFNVVLLHT
jgi:hypothetical protein